MPQLSGKLSTKKQNKVSHSVNQKAVFTPCTLITLTFHTQNVTIKSAWIHYSQNSRIKQKKAAMELVSHSP